MAFTMKKGVSVTLTGDGTTQQFRAGDFVVSPGMAADAVRFKMRLTLANSGSARALTGTEVQTFLSGFDVTMRLGNSQAFTPYSKMDLAVAEQLTRAGRASEWEGMTDSSTGLGQSIGSSTAVTFYPRIPFSAFWQEPAFADLWRIGSLQARRVIFDVRRNTVSLPSGFSISGSVYLDIIPDESPSRYELWSPVPRYYEFEEASRVALTIPTGLTFLLAERTAVHASTSLTTVKLNIDGLTLYENVTPGEIITRYNDTTSYFPAEANITDRRTLLYAIAPGTYLRELPTGKPRFEQQVQSLSTMKLAWWGLELLDESQTNAEVQALADDAGTRIKAVSIAAVMGLQLPKNIVGFLPWCIFREGEKEFEQYPGRIASPNGSVVEVVVPHSLASTVKGFAAHRESLGEYAAAEEAYHQVTLAVPGAVQSPRGLRGGSSVLDRVRSAIKSS